MFDLTLIYINDGNPFLVMVILLPNINLHTFPIFFGGIIR